MKSFLVFLVAMGSTVTLGSSGCVSLAQFPRRSYRGCMWKGKLYPFGYIERTEDCHKCHCRQTEMTCCSLFGTPVSYDKKECKVLINKKRCDYDVVQRKDPSKMCLAYGSVL